MARVAASALDTHGDPYRSPTAEADAASGRAVVPLELADLGRGDAEELPCPRCAHGLGVVEGQPSCRGCGGCGGVFVESEALRRPHDELPGVVEPEASAPALDVAPYVRCPVCGEMMARSVFGKRSGVVVDVCRAHGTWFDHGELVRAIEFVERGGLEEAARREAREEAEAHDEARRAGAQLDASLLADAARDARRIGWWTGRLGARNRTLIDALYDLLR